MKKFLSILLVLILVLSLSITAFATEGTGSITITNATLGEDYYVYKLFNATYAEGSDAVSYTLDPANTQFNNIFFDAEGNPTAENKYFVLNTNTNGIEKAQGVNDSELTKYLQELITMNPSLVPVASKEDVNSTTVTFDDLAYGYYIVKTSMGTTVTITSNTPDVNVIDKNQVPGGEFDKSVQTGVDADGNPVYGSANSAGIGDTFNYKIEFIATNYDGDKLIKYYQINDQKGDALWAEFNSFKVTIDGTELNRGYYLCLGDSAELNTNEWEYLGNWTDEEIASGAKPQWYLVHLGFDQFRVTIPWLENHSLIEETTTDGKTTYTLTFPEGAKSLYDSPSEVVITYMAAVEGSAQIGGNGHNLYNEAYTSWTTEHESGSTSTDRTETAVYGLGILKDDMATGKNLANAEFRIYSDEACTEEVYIIPTGIEGVYIADSLGKPVLTGSKMQTSRDIYDAYLAAYLGDDYKTSGKQDNLMVTPVNGKVVVLGLAEGTYYVLETKAPDSYNALSTAVSFVLNKENAKPFAVYANQDGKVADIQSASGDFAENDYLLTNTIVHNSQGTQLPATGGEGTFWLITIGTLMAIGFAVFLITHKKMSVYND